MKRNANCEKRAMKINPQIWRSILAMVGIILSLALAHAPKAVADDQQPGVFPPDKNAFGMTYGDWSAAWWQHVLSISTDKNPNTDLTGVNCNVGQSSGPVFFLQGAPITDPVTRTCTIPARKALFFPLVTIECSNVEAAPFFGGNAQDMRTCAAAFVDGVDANTLKVTVDGRKVQKLRQFRAQSPLFDFIMPAANNLLGLPGVTSGSSVSDGYWVMLKPSIPIELSRLIKRMAQDNPLWGEKRIAKELLVKLGVCLSPRTVRKCMPEYAVTPVMGAWGLGDANHQHVLRHCHSDVLARS